MTYEKAESFEDLLEAERRYLKGEIERPNSVEYDPNGYEAIMRDEILELNEMGVLVFTGQLSNPRDDLAETKKGDDGLYRQERKKSVTKFYMMAGDRSERMYWILSENPEIRLIVRSGSTVIHHNFKSLPSIDISQFRTNRKRRALPRCRWQDSETVDIGIPDPMFDPNLHDIIKSDDIHYYTVIFNEYIDESVEYHVKCALHEVISDDSPVKDDDSDSDDDGFLW